MFFAIFAALIASVFLRPVTEQKADGTIVSSNFREAGTYAQHQPGVNRGFRTPTEITIAEAVVFEIKIDTKAEPVKYSENTLSGKNFFAGQKIKVKYIERGLGSLWRRVYITEISAID